MRLAGDKAASYGFAQVAGEAACAVSFINFKNQTEQDFRDRQRSSAPAGLFRLRYLSAKLSVFDLMVEYYIFFIVESDG